MAYRNGNYSAFYVKVPFNESNLSAHATKDFVSYSMLRAWKGADSAALVANEGSPEIPQYHTLGLTADACVVEESEGSEFHSEIISGKDNLVVRLQGEYAYNLGLKGMAWDVANGGVNPDDTAVGTGSNWDGSGAGPIMDNAKDFGGVVLRTL